MLDTVEVAAATPEKEQPYAALGLKPDEYERIRNILGRRPTSAELAMYSVMWSEHCSYKSSKIYLRQFGKKVTPEMKQHLMVGMGENAGVLDIGEGWAVTFKIESHNHPSYIEPFQGAATGVGGIVRDIISMGARPVAVMDALRFGAIDHPDTARVVHGVVSGISFYGNCLGLPNIGGETWFDPVYQANPLVNALAVGVLRHEDLHLANAKGAGNKVVLFGARTGGDGIGGASILASDTFAEGGPTKRPAVQVGDPFAEKVLIECCLELFAGDLVEGIQDLGAAGISCATSELASNGDGGMAIVLDDVLLRDPTLTPEEILMSESQERMMAIVRPRSSTGFLEVVKKWDVETSVLGEVTDTGRLSDHVARRGDRERRPAHRRRRRPGLRAPGRLPVVDRRAAGRRGRRPRPPADGRRRCARSSCSSSARPTRRMPRGSRTSTTTTCSATPPSPTPTTPAWSASTRSRASASRSRPTRTAATRSSTRARARSSPSPRRTATSPSRARSPWASPTASTSARPENPEVMWQFSEAVEGLADGCLELGIPVTGGNVTFYNQTGDVPIHPTPVVAVLGVIDDVAAASVGLAGRRPEHLPPRRHGAELDGSAWAGIVHDHLGGRPPAVDLAARSARRAARTRPRSRASSTRRTTSRRRPRDRPRRGRDALRRRRARVPRRGDPRMPASTSRRRSSRSRPAA